MPKSRVKHRRQPPTPPALRPTTPPAALHTLSIAEQCAEISEIFALLHEQRTLLKHEAQSIPSRAALTIMLSAYIPYIVKLVAAILQDNLGLDAEEHPTLENSLDILILLCFGELMMQCGIAFFWLLAENYLNDFIASSRKREQEIIGRIEQQKMTPAEFDAEVAQLHEPHRLFRSEFILSHVIFFLVPFWFINPDKRSWAFMLQNVIALKDYLIHSHPIVSKWLKEAYNSTMATDQILRQLNALGLDHPALAWSCQQAERPRLTRYVLNIDEEKAITLAPNPTLTLTLPTIDYMRELQSVLEKTDITRIAQTERTLTIRLSQAFPEEKHLVLANTLRNHLMAMINLRANAEPKLTQLNRITKAAMYRRAWFYLSSREVETGLPTFDYSLYTTSSSGISYATSLSTWLRAVYGEAAVVLEEETLTVKGHALADEAHISSVIATQIMKDLSPTHEFKEVKDYRDHHNDRDTLRQAEAERRELRKQLEEKGENRADSPSNESPTANTRLKEIQGLGLGDLYEMRVSYAPRHTFFARLHPDFASAFRTPADYKHAAGIIQSGNVVPDNLKTKEGCTGIVVTDEHYTRLDKTRGQACFKAKTRNNIRLFAEKRVIKLESGSKVNIVEFNGVTLAYH